MSMINLKEFRRKKILEMAAYQSASVLQLPISESMSCFVSMIRGSVTQRAKVLQWLMTDGLAAASQSRDLVCKALNGFNVVNLKLPEDLKKMCQERRNKKNVHEVIDSRYERYEQDYPAGIHPCDIFSPIARERDEYLRAAVPWIEKNFEEPKWIYIPMSSGEHEGYPIEDINKRLASRGMPVFKYGGIKGYLQFAEKGDWLPASEKRGYDDPNQQHHVDLSRGVISSDEKYGVRAEFVGGALRKSIKKFTNKVNEAEIMFDDFLKGKLESAFDPQQYERLNNLYKQIDMQPYRFGKDINDILGTQIGDMYLKLRTLACEIKDVLMAIFKEGLNNGIFISHNVLTRFNDDPDRLFQSYKEVTVRKKTNGYMVFFSETQKEIICNYIQSYLDKDTLIMYWNWFSNSVGLKDEIESRGIKIKTTDISRWRGYFHRIFNSGLKTIDSRTKEIYTNQVKKMFRYEILDVYGDECETMPIATNVDNTYIEKLIKNGNYEWSSDKKSLIHKGQHYDEIKVIHLGKDDEGNDRYNLEKPSEFVYKCKMAVYAENVSDEYIDKLRAKGYKWTKSKKSLVFPNETEVFDSFKVIHLPPDKFGNKRYTLEKPDYAVVQAFTPGRKDIDVRVAMIPRDKKGNFLKIKSRPTQYATITPARGNNARQLLIRDLKDGKWGESPDWEPDSKNLFPYESDLPSLQLRLRDFLKDKGIAKEDYLALAMAGLYNFTGDIAFKFGYLGKSLLKNKSAIGFLRENGVKNPKEQIDRLVQKVKAGNYSWEAFSKDFDANVVKAIGENALAARKDYVSSYVSSKFNVESKGEERQASQFANPDTKYDPHASASQRGFISSPHVEKGFAPLSKRAHDRRLKNPEEITQEPEFQDAQEFINKLKKGENKRNRNLGIEPPKPEPKRLNFAISSTPLPLDVAAREVPPSSPPKKLSFRISSDSSTKSVPDVAAKEAPPPVAPKKLSFKISEENLICFDAWKEMAGTDAVSPKKPKDGCGYNVWGAAGDPMGISIGGEINTRNKHGRRKKK